MLSLKWQHSNTSYVLLVSVLINLPPWRCCCCYLVITCTTGHLEGRVSSREEDAVYVINQDKSSPLSGTNLSLMLTRRTALANRNGSHTMHRTWVFIVRESGLTTRQVRAETVFFSFFFFKQSETLFWQSRLKHCLLSCTKDSQKSKVCLPNRSVILKSNTKTMPRHPGVSFYGKKTGHKWPLCCSPQLWQSGLRPAIDGQSYGWTKKKKKEV